MSRLSAIPGLPPEAVEQLTSCGVETAEMLAGIAPAEIHRVLELAAWKKGRLNRAPELEVVQSWAELARRMPAGAASDDISRTDPSAGEGDDLPEAIVIPSANLDYRGGYIPPAQRARLQTGGSAKPAGAHIPLAMAAAAAPDPGTPSSEIPMALPQPAAAPQAPLGQIPVATPWNPDKAPGIRPATARVVPATPAVAPPPVTDPGNVRFTTFSDYQAGNVRVAPLNRLSIDAPSEPMAPASPERINANEELPRTMRRGVVHPSPGLLIFGALISLLWRLAAVAALGGSVWLLLHTDRPSDYAAEISIAAGVLLLLGMAQLVVMGKARCRICSCHLFYSRNCVKNRKAHSLPGLGKTASLSLHLLLFQWFRCMYCGTAIKLWTSKGDRPS